MVIGKQQAKHTMDSSEPNLVYFLHKRSFPPVSLTMVYNIMPVYNNGPTEGVH
jgi:uncharacterized protein (DUF3820 family)